MLFIGEMNFMGVSVSGSASSIKNVTIATTGKEDVVSAGSNGFSITSDGEIFSYSQIAGTICH